MPESKPVKRYVPLMQTLAAAQRWNDVVRQAGLWLAEEPDSVAAHCAMASALLQLDQIEAAEHHARAARAARPDSRLGHQLVAEVYSRRGQWRQALESIQVALTLGANDADLHFLAAKIYLNLRRIPEALGEARQARTLEPRETDYAHLVIALERMDQDTAQSAYNAITELENALALDPLNAKLLFHIGRQYSCGLEDDRTAEEFVRQALALDPTNRAIQDELFEIVSRRDVVYRTLNLPRRTLAWVVDLRHGAPLRFVLPWLLLGLFAWLPPLVWLSASALLLYPATMLYQWLFLGDLLANRSTRPACGRLLRAVGRAAKALRWAVGVTVQGGLWAACFYLCHVPQAIGWTFLIVTIGVNLALTLWQRNSRQAAARETARIEAQGVILADEAPDDPVLLSDTPRGTGSGRPLTVPGVWSGMSPKVRFLVGVPALGVVLGLVTICSGVGYLGVKTFGNLEGQRVAELVEDHPLVLEKLGGIERCEFNLAADLIEAGRSEQLYDVRGPKGSGQLIAVERFYQYRSIKLRTSEGEWELLEGDRDAARIQRKGSQPGVIRIKPRN
ncbi:MAG: hypothetical protein WD278_06880 [Pirellulales bacterium]